MRAQNHRGAVMLPSIKTGGKMSDHKKAKQRLLAAASLAGAVVIFGGFLFLRHVGLVSIPGFIPEEQRRFSVEHQVNIAPHKALYTLDMASSQTGSSVAGIRGELFFKWEDACDAWATDHRFSMEYTYVDRPSLSATSDFVAWESKDGEKFQFSSESTENGEPSEVLRGNAARDLMGKGSADFTKPAGLSYQLPRGFYFSSEHTVELVARAAAGEKFFHAVMFDGTDQEGPVEVNAVIGPEVLQGAAVPEAPVAGIDADLLKGRAWKVRLAFFAIKEIDPTPLYEMTIVLHENGVVSYIAVDYRAFSVVQKLKALEKLPPGNC